MSEPTPRPAVELPPVPKTGPSWVVKIYLGLAAGVLGAFVLAGLLGWEFHDSVRDRAPGSARQSPGFRTYHFWHSGYHGGK